MTPLPSWSSATPVAAGGSLLLVDIDRFKESVNDILGHAAGDDALRIAENAVELSAETVGAKAFRYGGDSFVVVCSRDEAAVIALAERIRREIEQSLRTFGHVTASVGIARAMASVDSTQMVVAADLALSDAKGQGGIAARSVFVGSTRVVSRPQPLVRSK